MGVSYRTGSMVSGKSKANDNFRCPGKAQYHWSPRPSWVLRLPVNSHVTLVLLSSGFPLPISLGPGQITVTAEDKDLMRSSLRQGAQLTLSKLGSASPSFIHLCLQICSIERRLFGSNTSMWRIKCSHSVTDKQWPASRQ